jgi:tRNA-dihydrouridine synthase B
VLDHTKAAAVMIGRAAQGRPWIFREIEHYLRTGEELPEPSLDEVREILSSHLRELYRFYGEFMGPRIARKHAGWYLQTVPNSEAFRKEFNKLETAQAQDDSVQDFFEQLIKKEEIAA